MLKISCTRDFQSDQKLRVEILALASPSYVDPISVLEREYNSNQRVYLARNETNELVAFFMCGLDKLSSVSINYLGWACVDGKHQNSGAIKLLFLQCIEDCIEQNVSSFNWCTTASPAIFRVIHHLWDDVYPTAELKYNDFALGIVKQIADKHGYKADKQFPFVFRQIAVGTKYSATEIETLKEHAANEDLVLFDRLQINEQNGDRIIMLCKTPSQEKVVELRRLLQ